MPDLSKAEKEFLQRKHEQTMKLRAEFLKQSSNPFRHATGEGGTVVSKCKRRQALLCHLVYKKYIQLKIMV